MLADGSKPEARSEKFPSWLATAACMHVPHAMKIEVGKASHNKSVMPTIQAPAHHVAEPEAIALCQAGAHAQLSLGPLDRQQEDLLDETKAFIMMSSWSILTMRVPVSQHYLLLACPASQRICGQKHALYSHRGGFCCNLFS